MKLIKNKSNLIFNEALEAMNKGAAIAREAWVEGTFCTVLPENESYVKKVSDFLNIPNSSIKMLRTVMITKKYSDNFVEVDTGYKFLDEDKNASDWISFNISKEK